MYLLGDFTLQLWDDGIDDKQLFINHILGFISPFYEEIDSSYAENILRIHNKGYDEYGYFTISKDVWVIKDSIDSQTIGYEIITRKRGGSIKVGPTIIFPDFQHKGIAKKIIKILELHYMKQGFRKIYATSPINHLGAASLDYNELGWQTEAIMKNQYRTGQAERVAGKLLIPNSKGVSRIVKDFDQDDKVINKKIIIKVGLPNNCDLAFQDLIIELMSPYYDDINIEFAKSIVSAGKRSTLHKENKGKVIICSYSGNRLVGAIISTPKRGNGVKLAPILIQNGFRTRNLLRDMVYGTIHWYKVNFPQYQRFYTLIPVQEYYMIRFFVDMNWNIEGIIREPYKMGIDCLLFSYLED